MPMVVPMLWRFLAKCLFPSTLTFLLLAGFPAWAEESQCGPRDHLVKQLAEKYGEVRVAYGLTSGNGVFEVMVSPTGTWTLMLTPRRGFSCLLAAGEDWEADPKPVPGRDS